MANVRSSIRTDYTNILDLVDRRGLNVIAPNVIDRYTFELVEVENLLQSINSSVTRIGSTTLRRSVTQPLTNVKLIRAKQEALQELNKSDDLIDGISDTLKRVERDEDGFIDFLKGNVNMENQYFLYASTQHFLHNLVKGINKLPDVSSEYLNALISDVKDFGQTRLHKFSSGAAFNTARGLIAKSETKFYEPRVKHTFRSLKPAVLTPIGLGIAGSIAYDLQMVGLLLPALYLLPVVQKSCMKYDFNKFTTPLKEMHKNNEEMRIAVEAMGRLDELLSLTEYQRKFGSDMTIPLIEDLPSHKFRATGLRNPIVGKENPAYVPNDVDMDGSRLTIITGPNSGGKTAYCKSIVQSQILAQIGSYVPAQSAEISVADRILYQAPMVNSVNDREGRFGTEVNRIKEIFYQISPRSLVVFDEMIEATTFEEKHKHSYDIMEDFYSIGGNTLLTTHNHHLAQEMQKAGKGRQLMVEFDGHMPTHRLIPGVSRESHSDLVLDRLEFTTEDRRAYLKRKGYSN